MKLLNVSAWGLLGAALFLGAIFTMAAGFTLMTTQLLFIYGFASVNQLHYGWGVLAQIYSAVNGGYSGDNLLAVMLSWILLACYTIANSVKRWVKNGIAHEGIEFFCHFMILLDGIANWSALASKPWYWQVLFPVGIYVVLAYFGKIIVGLLHSAILEFF